VGAAAHLAPVPRLLRSFAEYRTPPGAYCLFWQSIEAPKTPPIGHAETVFSHIKIQNSSNYIRDRAAEL